MAFCKWLSKKEGVSYRLPTEAEWEYACRAGTTTRFHFGNSPQELDTFAWHRGRGRLRSEFVGGKKANPFGLHDMYGNVAEWCHDAYAPYKKALASDPVNVGATKVVRGGGFSQTAADIGSARRRSVIATLTTCDVGFRVVKVLPLNPVDDPAPAGAREVGLKFDGKAYVDLPGFELDLTKPFTFECYVRFDAGRRERSVVISRKGGPGFALYSTDGTGLTLELSGERVGHAHRVGNWRIEPRRTHIAITWDTQNVRVFGDGVLLDKRGLHPQVHWLGKARFLLGASWDGEKPVASFRGTLGEIHFSNTVRYSENFQPSPRFKKDANTLALYLCDSGQRTKLIDSSGDNYHGVIHGATWVKAGDSKPTINPPS